MTGPKVTYSIDIDPEYEPVRGNALASGEDAMDKEVEDEIIRRIDQGDNWAWCRVVVTAECEGFDGISSLGCCSYKDEEDFKQGGYYEDMKKEALSDLLAGLESTRESGCLASRLLLEFDSMPEPEEKCADCGIEYSKTVSHQADCPRIKEV